MKSKFGYALLAVNIFWCWDNAWMYYQYNFTEKLFLFQFPIWTLALNFVISILGSVFSISAILGKHNLKKVAIINLSAIGIGAAIRYLSVM